MVTVDSRNGPIRNSVLPNHMTDLANFIGLGSRYAISYHGKIIVFHKIMYIRFNYTYIIYLTKQQNNFSTGKWS